MYCLPLSRRYFVACILKHGGINWFQCASLCVCSMQGYFIIPLLINKKASGDNKICFYYMGMWPQKRNVPLFVFLRNPHKASRSPLSWPFLQRPLCNTEPSVILGSWSVNNWIAMWQTREWSRDKPLHSGWALQYGMACQPFLLVWRKPPVGNGRSLLGSRCPMGNLFTSEDFSHNMMDVFL